MFSDMSNAGKGNGLANGRGGNIFYLDSFLQKNSDVNNDDHSSEEELEVINSRPKEPLICRNGSRCGNLSVTLRSASVSALPEKRRWSEINLSNAASVDKINRLSVTPSGRIDHSSGSSDDEVQGLLSMGTPVEFRSSPPRDLVRPGNSRSPPPKLFHQQVSTRRRHRQHGHKPHHLLQRPCLDFEKMQQLKARAVTAWRHDGDHGGELSVYCW